MQSSISVTQTWENFIYIYIYEKDDFAEVFKNLAIYKYRFENNFVESSKQLYRML